MVRPTWINEFMSDSSQHVRAYFNTQAMYIANVVWLYLFAPAYGPAFSAGLYTGQYFV